MSESIYNGPNNLNVRGSLLLEATIDEVEFSESYDYFRDPKYLLIPMDLLKVSGKLDEVNLLYAEFIIYLAYVNDPTMSVVELFTDYMHYNNIEYVVHRKNNEIVLKNDTALLTKYLEYYRPSGCDLIFIGWANKSLVTDISYSAIFMIRSESNGGGERND